MKTSISLIFLSAIVSVIISLNGCKKNDEDVNVSLIESKLTSDSSQYWSAPITLEIDTIYNPVILQLSSNHKFKYIATPYNVVGDWSVDYAANRSGQYLTLNCSYIFESKPYNQSFALKYSSDQDVFYALSQSDQSLQIFTKTEYNP